MIQGEGGASAVPEQPRSAPTRITVRDVLPLIKTRHYVEGGALLTGALTLLVQSLVLDGNPVAILLLPAALVLGLVLLCVILPAFSPLIIIGGVLLIASLLLQIAAYLVLTLLGMACGGLAGWLLAASVQANLRPGPEEDRGQPRLLLAGALGCALLSVPLGMRGYREIKQPLQEPAATEAERPAQPEERPAVPVRTGEAAPQDADPLKEAEAAYEERDPERALRLSAPLLKGDDAMRAHRVHGAAACALRRAELARRAYQHLDASGRKYLIDACGEQGLVFRKGRFYRDPG